MIAIPRLARRARRVIEVGQEVRLPLRQDRSRCWPCQPACHACLGGKSRGRYNSSAVSAAVGPQAMARQGALAQNGLAQLARPDSTDATHIFQCPLVLPSLLLIDGDRPGLRRQDGTLETALLRCFCAFDIWCQVLTRVGASALLTALACESSATLLQLVKRQRTSGRTGHTAGAPVGVCASQQTDQPMENSRMFWLGRRRWVATQVPTRPRWHKELPSVSPVRPPVPLLVA